MQNRSDSGTLCFSTPNPPSRFPVNEMNIKVPEGKKYWIKVWFVSNILNFDLNLYVDKRDRSSTQCNGYSL